MGSTRLIVWEAGAEGSLMGSVRYTIVDGEVLSENRDGVKLDYVPDPLGSTISLLNNSQVQVGTASYWPYGEQSGGTGITTFRGK